MITDQAYNSCWWSVLRCFKVSSWETRALWPMNKWNHWFKGIASSMHCIAVCAPEWWLGPKSALLLYARFSPVSLLMLLIFSKYCFPCQVSLFWIVLTFVRCCMICSPTLWANHNWDYAQSVKPIRTYMAQWIWIILMMIPYNNLYNNIQ